MAKWSIIWEEGDIGSIVKDGVGALDVDLSWLPDEILAVQSPDGVTCEIERGVRSTMTNTENDENVATNTLSWWSNVNTTWQAAYDAAQAALTSQEEPEE